MNTPDIFGGWHPEPPLPEAPANSAMNGQPTDEALMAGIQQRDAAALERSPQQGSMRMSRSRSARQMTGTQAGMMSRAGGGGGGGPSGHELAGGGAHAYAKAVLAVLAGAVHAPASLPSPLQSPRLPPPQQPSQEACTPRLGSRLLLPGLRLSTAISSLSSRSSSTTQLETSRAVVPKHQNTCTRTQGRVLGSEPSVAAPPLAVLGRADLRDEEVEAAQAEREHKLASVDPGHHLLGQHIHQLPPVDDSLQDARASKGGAWRDSAACGTETSLPAPPLHTHALLR